MTETDTTPKPERHSAVREIPIVDDEAGAEELAEFLRTHKPGRDYDGFLETLVHLLNKFDLDFAVSVCVGGTVVSGRALSVKKYFEAMGETLSGGVDDLKTSRQVARTIASWGRPAEGDAGPLLPAFYLHLRDARVVVGGPAALPTSGGSLWRIRLSEVGGFTMGEYTVATEREPQA
jgi:hypothetical protein